MNTKLLALIIIISFVSSTIYAQQGILKGKLQDSASKQTLCLATITIFYAKDTSIITYRLSDPQGGFRIPGLPLNVLCRTIITFSGYRIFRKEFQLTPDQPQLDLGLIFLVNDPKSLEEVVITAERPPVTVKKDTIEFNASAFKTLPSALVEDLLRKLPGVQVDRDGSITVNGKRVNRILVDGKSFFGDDPKMATRNLPANVIEKVQVTRDKEEEDRNTDGDLSNVGSIINLTLKKGVKKGWFGKVYAGAGTRDRYESGGIGNIYRDTMQLSVLAFSNNVNRTGFSIKEVQDLGGFNRSGTNSMMMMSRGNQQGFAINGISFGGLEQGIARTSGVGFNMNHAPNRNTNFFAQYFYGGNRAMNDDLNNNQQFINDTVINTRSSNSSLKKTGTHTISLGANLKMDTLTDLRFRANYIKTSGNDFVTTGISTVNDKIGLLNSGDGERFNSSGNHDLNENLSITRRFSSKKGRSLNIYQNLSYRSSLLRNITESENEFYYPVLDTVLFEQMRQQEIPVFNTGVNATYSEPIGKKITVITGVNVNYQQEEQSITTYSKGLGKEYNSVNETLSSGFKRDHYRYSGSLSVAYKIKQVTVTAGVNTLGQIVSNRFRGITAPVKQELFNILPTVNVNWKQLNISYRQEVSPAMTFHLIPVPDNSNPFFIRKGNSNLKPRRNKSIHGNYYKYDQKSATNFNLYLNGQFINDDVILLRTIDEKGIQTTIPVNADGTKYLSSSINFGKEFKNKQKFIFSFRMGTWMNFNQQKLLVNNNTGLQTATQLTPSAGFGLNWNDKIEIKPEYRISFSKTRYTDPAFRNLNVITQNLDGEFIVRGPKKLVWETNVNYRYNSQVAPGIPKDNLLWNAAVTYLMLREQKGQLRLSIFDILNRNNNVYRYATQNFIIDNQSSVLQRFISLTFTYNIRTMGAPKKVGGRDRLFFY